MRTPINDGGPAFPIHDSGYNPTKQKWEPLGATGMSLRDWFAGMAMQQFVDQRDHNIWASEKFQEARSEIAAAAYNIADAMLAAREKGVK